MRNSIRTRIMLVLTAAFVLPTSIKAGGDYWQQAVKYDMDIDFDVQKNQFAGKQSLQYFNNSPDTLNRVNYHLYFNAFQPGSMMDMRSRTIEDPDSRVGDRIAHLEPHEIGYLKVKSLKQDGKTLSVVHAGTILEVDLAEPLLPGASTTLEMDFDGQVPVQIRRSGRDNAEGIRYSMSQWYPKICEYDHMGWHANPYVGREFHGVWGDFEIKISIDATYMVAGTGYLQNPEEIGKGYEEPGTKVKKNNKEKLTWHFKAPKVHDFVWVADPTLVHKTHPVEDGPDLHFFYREDSLTKAWDDLPGYVEKAFRIMNRRFGEYPYERYSVIQGGDGGMEYPMATLVTGHRSLGSLVGVTVHELIHSWFQGVLASNEALFPWIDEGFTSYCTHEVLSELFGAAAMRNHKGSYAGYFDLVESGLAEPMSMHSDHYSTNRAYSINAYSKGTITLHQLSYVVGQDALDRAMRRFFREWQFRHPDEIAFRRCVEKESGMELDWYFEYWVHSTHTIDYGFGSVHSVGEKTRVELKRIGGMPMPTEVLVTYKNGDTEMFYIPLRMMRAEKPANGNKKRSLMPDWPWTHLNYILEIPVALDKIESMEIDPSGRMADVDRENNVFSPGELLGD